jgi:hypothetical protein
MFRARALLLALLTFGCLPASALASEVVQLHVRFLPFKLGASTTVETSFNISTTTGSAPSPLTNVAIRIPKGMDFTSTSLGTETCSRAVILEAPWNCSPSSIMGRGEATVELAVEPEPVFLTASITQFAGVPVNHHTTILFNAEIHTPVYEQLVYTSELLKAAAPFGGTLSTSIPFTPSWPEGPKVPVVHMRSTLGPLEVTYYTYVHHKRIGYHPTGIIIPSTCPRGGFPYEGIFTFEDGTQVTAKTTVPCPNRSRRHGA